MSKSSDKISTYISSGSCVSPLGLTTEENIENVIKHQSGIKKHNDKYFDVDPFYGAIIEEALLDQKLKTQKIENNSISKIEKLMMLASSFELEKYGQYVNERTGLIVSSTKGNIDGLSKNEEQSSLNYLANQLKNHFKITNQPIVISNACVSGLMAISVAKRLIESKVYDHVFIVAGDVFSRFVYSGFQSFQAVSEQPCKPYSKYRNGITLGEASSCVFMTKNPSDHHFFEVLTDSSINDANHISGPSRTGEGLLRSIENVMTRGQLNKSDIDFISSHGTATIYNDEMEAKALERAGLHNTPVFSLKGYFGHTLGCAGLIETIISINCAQKNLIPASLGYDEPGTSIPINVTNSNIDRPVEVFLKTASGFGGTNTAVAFKKING